MPLSPASLQLVLNLWNSEAGGIHFSFCRNINFLICWKDIADFRAGSQSPEAIPKISGQGVSAYPLLPASVNLWCPLKIVVSTGFCIPATWGAAGRCRPISSLRAPGKPVSINYRDRLCGLFTGFTIAAICPKTACKSPSCRKKQHFVILEEPCSLKAEWLLGFSEFSDRNRVNFSSFLILFYWLFASFPN